MSLLKQIAGQELIHRSQKVVYEQVTFTKGFQLFLEALGHERLLKNVVRSNNGSTYVWGDDRTLDGIRLETTDHPMTTNGYTNLIVLEGSEAALERAQELLKTHADIPDASFLSEVVDLDTVRSNNVNQQRIRDALGNSSNLSAVGSGIQTTAFKRHGHHSVIRYTRIYDIDTDLHLKFLKIAIQHQDNPFFPRIYGAKLYKAEGNVRGNPHIAIVEMEKLVPINTELFGNPKETARFFHNLGFDPDKLSSTEFLFHLTSRTVHLKPLIEKTKNEKFAEALTILLEVFHNHYLDLHAGNWMMRPTSTGPQIVIVDPVTN